MHPSGQGTTPHTPTHTQIHIIKNKSLKKEKPTIYSPDLSSSVLQLVGVVQKLTQSPFAACLSSVNAEIPETGHWPSAMYVLTGCVVVVLAPRDGKLFRSPPIKITAF